MFRIGQSSDIHRLVQDRRLILGGVDIPYAYGLLGHSDADALCHAIAEAIIGAMGLGDIGRHFPDTDPQYEGISSLLILAKVAEMLETYHFAIVNIDSLILIERPKMAPYLPQMKNNIAAALTIDPSQLNIKVTRGEGLSFIGREEGVMAQAVVLLESR
ncbi:2-C-methyl-D-erythritol 2,4-cyclodiphosphate synthase [bioreactor metagenome]|uniref:2-C-methyl-D-erythritol 2,4-cyclodiphosphate synthase n=1 Tax=bioreactor metagenome TaxID=1076179 RepID=A0A645FIF1_9ZZZZ